MTLRVDPLSRQKPNRRTRAIPVEQARAELKAVIDKLMAQAIDWHQQHETLRGPAFQSAIKITTGAGKSEALRRGIAEFVAEAKKLKLPHRVLFTVPTHKLANESMGRMPEGVVAAIWQGRGVRRNDAGAYVCEAKHVGTGEPMCRNPEAVGLAEEIGLDVEEAACRKGRRGQEPILCPFFRECHYQRQKAAAKSADVVLAAHEMSFASLDPFGHKSDPFGLVVIDEAFWAKGVKTTGQLVVSGLSHDLNRSPVRLGDQVLSDDTALLADLCSRLQRALGSSPEGYVSKAALLAEGLLPSTQHEEGSGRAAAKLEWRRKVDVNLRPDSSIEERRRKATELAFHGQLARRAAMWRAVDELLTGEAEVSGRLKLEDRQTSEGTVRKLRLLGREELHDSITALPIVHADATMTADIVKHWLPRLAMVADIEVDAPFERVTQIVGLSVGSKWLTVDDERAVKRRKRLADYIKRLARGRRSLAVTYKNARAELEGIEGLEVAHHGAIEGIDRWGNVEALVVVGRPLPSPKDIENLAAAVTGKPVVAGEPVLKGRAIRMKDGTSRMIEGRVYEQPEAELVRQAITDAGLAQAVGRARGVNRTTGSRVEVFAILSDTPLPGEVDQVVEFSDGAASKLLEQAIVPQFPGDAAKIYRDLFPTSQAARQVYRRSHLRIEDHSSKGVTVSNKDPLLATVTASTPVKYRPKGRGQAERVALVDLSRVPDPRAVLEAALGPLASFELLEAPQAQPAPPIALVAVSESQPVSKAPDRPSRTAYQQPLPLPGIALVVDLDTVREGKLPADTAAAIRHEMKARGTPLGEFAANVGLSKPQACNVLQGRFGMSRQAADRVRGWLSQTG